MKNTSDDKLDFGGQKHLGLLYVYMTYVYIYSDHH